MFCVQFYDQCDVKAANGDPASDIMVYVIVEMKSADGAYLSGVFLVLYILLRGLSLHVLSIVNESIKVM